MATTTRTKSSTLKNIKHEARVTKVVRDAAQETTNKVIAALEAGTVIWHKEWDGAVGLPTSLATGKAYQGSNVLVLWITALDKGYSSLYWGTYKQISERGGQVRKGERSTEIVRVIDIPVDDKAAQAAGQEGAKKRIKILRLFHVFNVDQADWGPDARLPQVVKRTPVEAIAAAEELIASYLASGPSLGHGGDRAFYAPATDHIQLPPRDAFHSAEALYSTLYHEATHSTGHSSREARPGIAEGTFGAFGDAVYSNEELVAELGAAMLCAIAGIEQQATLDSSAAYIAHWIKALKGDKGLIIQAAAAAQKAVNRIVGNLPADIEEEEES